MILGQFERAQEKIEKAINLDPLLIEYPFHLGGYYAYMGRYDEDMEIKNKMDELD